MLHLVGSSILLYLIDDARSNKNQINILRRIVHQVGLTYKIVVVVVVVVAVVVVVVVVVVVMIVKQL